MFELSLFCVLTFITFINAYIGRLINLVVKCVPEDPKIKSTAADVVTLENELKTISMFNEFSKHAKLQRRITSLKEVNAELVRKQALKTMKIKFSLTAAFSIIIFGTLVSLMWFYWSEPIIKVPAHWLWPLSSVSWSNSAAGTVSAPIWIGISYIASKTFAKHF